MAKNGSVGFAGWGDRAIGARVLGLKSADVEPTKTDHVPSRKISRKQQIAIFVLPLVYLWLMHRMGFFVITPVFIVAYLWTLEVRDWRHLTGVTAFIYLFVMAYIAALFYTSRFLSGAWPSFYDINNAIITIVRWGV